MDDKMKRLRQETEDRASARLTRRIAHAGAASLGAIFAGATVGTICGSHSAKTQHPTPIVTYHAPEQSPEDVVLDAIRQAQADEGTDWPDKRVIEEYQARLPIEIARREREKAVAYQPLWDAQAAQQSERTDAATVGVLGGGVVAGGLLGSQFLSLNAHDRRRKLAAQGKCPRGKGFEEAILWDVNPELVTITHILTKNAESGRVSARYFTVTGHGKNEEKARKNLDKAWKRVQVEYLKNPHSFMEKLHKEREKSPEKGSLSLA